MIIYNIIYKSASACPTTQPLYLYTSGSLEVHVQLEVFRGMHARLLCFQLVSGNVERFIGFQINWNVYKSSHGETRDEIYHTWSSIVLMSTELYMHIYKIQILRSCSFQSWHCFMHACTITSSCTDWHSTQQYWHPLSPTCPQIDPWIAGLDAHQEEGEGPVQGGSITAPARFGGDLSTRPSTWSPTWSSTSFPSPDRGDDYRMGGGGLEPNRQWFQGSSVSATYSATYGWSDPLRSCKASNNFGTYKGLFSSIEGAKILIYRDQ